MSSRRAAPYGLSIRPKGALLHHGGQILSKTLEVYMAINLPLEQPVILHPDPDDSAQQVVAALTAFQAGQSTAAAYRAQLNAIAARYRTCLNAWATLGELALPDDV